MVRGGSSDGGVSEEEGQVMEVCVRGGSSDGSVSEEEGQVMEVCQRRVK